MNSSRDYIIENIFIYRYILVLLQLLFCIKNADANVSTLKTKVFKQWKTL